MVFCKWYSICSYKLGVLGPWEFSGGPGHVYVSCVSPLVECRAGTSIFCHFVDVGGGTVWIFCFSWLRYGVYGTIEQVGVAGQ